MVDFSRNWIALLHEWIKDQQVRKSIMDLLTWEHDDKINSDIF